MSNQIGLQFLNLTSFFKLQLALTEKHYSNHFQKYVWLNSMTPGVDFIALTFVWEVDLFLRDNISSGKMSCAYMIRMAGRYFRFPISSYCLILVKQSLERSELSL